MQAINTGKPFLTADSTLPISMRVEDYVYTLSRDVLKNVPPAAPTSTWKNVTNRLKSKGKHSWLD
jgi:hypothetical protein